MRPYNSQREISTNSITNLGHPTLNLSPEERRLFNQLFNAADTDKLGVVTGEVAVKFFEKTRLSPAVLGEVGLPRIGISSLAAAAY